MTSERYTRLDELLEAARISSRYPLRPDQLLRLVDELCADRVPREESGLVERVPREHRRPKDHLSETLIRANMDLILVEAREFTVNDRELELAITEGMDVVKEAPDTYSPKDDAPFDDYARAKLRQRYADMFGDPPDGSAGVREPRKPLPPDRSDSVRAHSPEDDPPEQIHLAASDML